MEKLQVEIEVNSVVTPRSVRSTNADLLELSSLELALIGGGSGDVHFTTPPTP